VTDMLETGVAHPARIYDYWLGGRNNFPADREAAEQAIAANPMIVLDVRANRRFLARVVQYLAEECGVRQFLDIGTGLPTESNTHEVAQSVAKDARVVYVDNDPIVNHHARQLLTSHPSGSAAFLQADLRDLDAILLQASETLDLSQPVALMLLIVLHMIPDEDDPYALVANLMRSLAPGSYLVITHPASDIRRAAIKEMTKRINARLGPQRGTLRDRDQCARFFDGLELLEPGIVQPQRWRPTGPVTGAEVTAWSGVGRKL
jgi:SAM-dependent methyltransferase